MNEPPSPKRLFSPQRFRLLGYSLVGAGFLWLCASAFSLWKCPASATSQFAGTIPRHETYTYSEVFATLPGLRQCIEQELPSVLLPAILMLSGALILARTPPTPR